MNNDRAQFEQLLDAFLAGELGDDAQRRFEALLEAQPELRQEVELQCSVDDVLRATCAAPAGLASAAASAVANRDEIPAEVRTSKNTPSGASPWLRRVAVAAMLLLGAYGAWSTWNFIKPAKIDYPQPLPWRAPLQVYNDTIADGFKPAWVCKDDEEFIRSVRNMLGQRLAVAHADPGVRVLGIRYANTLSAYTVLILAMVDDKPVIVFADRKRDDRSVPNPASAALSWNRREVGNLVLYELSPYPEPRVLPLVFIPPKLKDDSCNPEPFDTMTFDEANEKLRH